MPPLTIELPESVLLSTGLSRDEFVREAKFLLALKLFELGRVSSGKAAVLCGISRVDFLGRASRMGVSVVNIDRDEAARECADD
ncbi:MAG: UPF0175 family protein [Planctomycetes bacterium]|nr:UPF0175 family protein [Planctomycetota bacterium]